MLHEILLSLSGYPSALFDASSKAGPKVNADFPLLSPPEHEMLKSVARLSKLHRELRLLAQDIAVQHPSVTCKAVASAIISGQLAAFQSKILAVEKSILTKDASTVGAYNIVPLAGVVGEFEEWNRLIEWLWNLARSMRLSKSLTCSGPDVINKLRKEAQTGYPDIEEAALQLGKVAETAWLRQLSSWVLYGRLPSTQSPDFFIKEVQSSDSNSTTDHEMESSLLPTFVTADTASSILFIGKSLNQIRSRSFDDSQTSMSSDLDLLPIHLKLLSELKLPISSASLSSTIRSIRQSLSQNVLQKLLPMDKVVRLLHLFREFFLLGRGEFAISLVREADDRLYLRNRSTISISTKDPLRSLVIKDAEVNTILTKTWTALASLENEDEEADDVLDLARDMILLSISKPTGNSSNNGSKSSSSSSFDGFLVAASTSLTLSITSPFDLFITQPDVHLYSRIHSYLISIRRAHMHLADLWKQTSMRRDWPTPLGPPKSCSDSGQQMLKLRRSRARKRYIEMRKIWATCSAALFLLGEVGEYFEGDVIKQLWDHLLKWITQSDSNPGDDEPTPHDPSSLASAHRIFINSLTQALLLADDVFTKHLKEMLHNIDQLVAQILRLQTIQRNVDLEEDEGIVDALANYDRDLTDCWTEVDRARKLIDAGSRALVGRLRESSNGSVALDAVSDLDLGDGSYTPLKDVGVERLLMKLDFASADQGDGSGRDDDFG